MALSPADFFKQALKALSNDGAGVVVVNPDGSNVGGSSAQTPIDQDLVVLNTTAAIEGTFTGDGATTQLVFITPSINGSGATAELILHDEDDAPLFASGELAESSKFVLPVNRQLTGTITIRIETSISVGANKTFTVKVQ